MTDPTVSPPLIPLTNTIRTATKHNSRTSHTQPLKGSAQHSNSPYSSSRYEHLPTSAPSSSSRFGSSSACPGCQKAVSPMELGVVPGPQGSRWHVACLVCGGKGAGKGRRDKSQPGCGKRLDSAAKRDGQGGVWCRECLVSIRRFACMGSRHSEEVYAASASIAREKSWYGVTGPTARGVVYGSQYRDRDRAVRWTSVDRHDDHRTTVYRTWRGRYLAAAHGRGNEPDETAGGESD